MSFIFSQGSCSVPASHFLSDPIIIFAAFCWMPILFCVNIHECWFSLYFWLKILFFQFKLFVLIYLPIVCWSAAVNCHFNALLQKYKICGGSIMMLEHLRKAVTPSAVWFKVVLRLYLTVHEPWGIIFVRLVQWLIVIFQHIMMEHNLVSLSAPEILSYEPISLATDIWWV